MIVKKKGISVRGLATKWGHYCYMEECYGKCICMGTGNTMEEFYIIVIGLLEKYLCMGTSN